jgi:hypothetical protein
MISTPQVKRCPADSSERRAFGEMAELVDAIDGYSTMGKKAQNVWSL